MSKYEFKTNFQMIKKWFRSEDTNNKIFFRVVPSDNFNNTHLSFATNF